MSSSSQKRNLKRAGRLAPEHSERWKRRPGKANPHSRKSPLDALCGALVFRGNRDTSNPLETLSRLLKRFYGYSRQDFSSRTTTRQTGEIFCPDNLISLNRPQTLSAPRSIESLIWLPVWIYGVPDKTRESLDVKSKAPDKRMTKPTDLLENSRPIERGIVGGLTDKSAPDGVRA